MARLVQTADPNERRPEATDDWPQHTVTITFTAPQDRVNERLLDEMKAPTRRIGWTDLVCYENRPVEPDLPSFRPEP